MNHDQGAATTDEPATAEHQCSRPAMIICSNPNPTHTLGKADRLATGDMTWSNRQAARAARAVVDPLERIDEAHRAVRDAQKRIRLHLKNGKVGKVKHAIREMMMSIDTAIAAAHYVGKFRIEKAREHAVAVSQAITDRARRAVAAGHHVDMTAAYLEADQAAERIMTAAHHQTIELATQAYPFQHSGDHAFARQVPKLDGGHRITIRFPDSQKTLQRIFALATEDIIKASLRPDQYILNGGQSAAVKAMVAAANKGRKWFEEQDMVHAYDNLDDREGILELIHHVTGLTTNFTRHIVFEDFAMWLPNSHPNRGQQPSNPCEHCRHQCSDPSEDGSDQLDSVIHTPVCTGEAIRGHRTQNKANPQPQTNEGDETHETDTDNDTNDDLDDETTCMGGLTLTQFMHAQRCLTTRFADADLYVIPGLPPGGCHSSIVFELCVKKQLESLQVPDDAELIIIADNITVAANTKAGCGQLGSKTLDAICAGSMDNGVLPLASNMELKPKAQPKRVKDPEGKWTWGEHAPGPRRIDYGFHAMGTKFRRKRIVAGGTPMTTVEVSEPRVLKKARQDVFELKQFYDPAQQQKPITSSEAEDLTDTAVMKLHDKCSHKADAAIRMVSPQCKAGVHAIIDKAMVKAAKELWPEIVDRLQDYVPPPDPVTHGPIVPVGPLRHRRQRSR
ncbi:MAG: hypothetical protein HQL37_03530 [Alphaproteobacteria bacterium]|nr:hypothetical protein [Alphaproteobacteria bacterium]